MTDAVDADGEQRNESRVKRVPLYDELIEPLFKGKMTMVEGLPDDATLRDIYHDPARNMEVFVFLSEEFEPVEEGKVIPLLELEVEYLDVGELLDNDD